ncbi:energy transducer TonB [Brevundimonas sp.]|uniref:energy transducer TonB n=1 Tax=Brevundimonas sp. TaxID=1871086 RepID=UPI0025B9BDFB|nr:energy transducer TonB [Brevundimonas sp.]
MIALSLALIVQAAPAGSLPAPRWTTPPRFEYPARAVEHGVAGEVIVRCSYRPDQRNCVILKETPSDMGFGREAIRAIMLARPQPDQEGEFDIRANFSLQQTRNSPRP